MMVILLKWNVLWAGLKWLRAGCCGHGSKHLGCTMAGDFLTRWTTICYPVAWNELQPFVQVLYPVWPVIHVTDNPASSLANFLIFGIISRVVFSADPRLAASISLSTSLFIIILPGMSFSQRIMTPCSMVVGHHFSCGDKIVFLKYLYHL